MVAGSAAGDVGLFKLETSDVVGVRAPLAGPLEFNLSRALRSGTTTRTSSARLRLSVLTEFIRRRTEGASALRARSHLTVLSSTARCRHFRVRSLEHDALIHSYIACTCPVSSMAVQDADVVRPRCTAACLLLHQLLV